MYVLFVCSTCFICFLCFMCLFIGLFMCFSCYPFAPFVLFVSCVLFASIVPFLRVFIHVFNNVLHLLFMCYSFVSFTSLCNCRMRSVATIASVAPLRTPQASLKTPQPVTFSSSYFLQYNKLTYKQKHFLRSRAGRCHGL